MRRRYLAAVVLAVMLLLGMTASTTAAPQPLGETAGVSECAWVRHSKRVMKHVRRHGKVRRVVRTKHWSTCEAQTTTPVLPPPALTPTPPAPAPEREPEANRLAVKSAEYYFTLSRPTVKPGAVTVELNNQGQDPHNLNLQLEGGGGEPLQIPETDSLEHSVANFDLPQGKYRLWCSLPEHEEKGMETTLRVE